MLKGLKIELQIRDLMLELLETYILLALEKMEPVDANTQEPIHNRIIEAPNLTYPNNYYSEESTLLIKALAEEYITAYGLVIPNNVFAKIKYYDGKPGLILVFE